MALNHTSISINLGISLFIILVHVEIPVIFITALINRGATFNYFVCFEENL